MTETAVCKWCTCSLPFGVMSTCFYSPTGLCEAAVPSPAVPETQAAPIPEDLRGEYEAAQWRYEDSGSPGGKHKMNLIERIARLESSLAHEQIAKLRALGQLQTAQEALARAEATIAELEASLRKRAEDEYCTYVSAMKRPECLGWKQKVKDGTFGETELTGHTAAAIHLGRHQAFADAARATGKES